VHFIGGLTHLREEQNPLAGPRAVALLERLFEFIQGDAPILHGSGSRFRLLMALR
jgi:hypothetical protein